MLTWGGREAAQTISSAISSAVTVAILKMRTAAGKERENAYVVEGLRKPWLLHYYHLGNGLRKTQFRPCLD